MKGKEFLRFMAGFSVFYLLLLYSLLCYVNNNINNNKEFISKYVLTRRIGIKIGDNIDYYNFAGMLEIEGGKCYIPQY